MSQRFRLWWLVPAFLVACSGGGSCGGCSCLQPIPGGFKGRKVEKAVVAKVTNEGFTFVSQNFAALLAQAGMQNPMQVPVPCSNVSFGSDGHLCDQNRNNSCDPGEQCTVTVNILSLTVAPADPTAPDMGILKASARLQIATGDLWMRTCAAELFGACLCRLTCAANFSSTRSGNPTDTFSADVNFTIDSRWDRVLAFDVANVGGINSLEGGDLDVRTSGICSALACSVLDLGFIKNFVMDQFLKPQLIAEVRKAVDDARCRSCSASAPCPTGATCTSGKCMAAGRCLPTVLGTEGRLDLSQAAAGLPLNGSLDVYAVAGGTVSSKANDFLSVGLLGGGEPYTGMSTDAGTPIAATCVPSLPPPANVMIPAPDWNAVDGGYHVGIAVGAKYLEQVMWATHQSGALCIDLGTQQVSLLSTGLFSTFLPSLGKLSTVDGKDAPMIIAIRPLVPPTLTIGKGTFDPVTKKPLEPLLKLDWKDLDIDVYAMIAERYVRLFRLTADISIPLSLIFEGCDKVTPALGDIKQLITNVRATESEILAEDPQALADLIPSLLTLAESSLAGGLGPQSLPSFGGFKLKINDAKGITQATVGYEHLGLFASLLLPNASCAVAAPRALARLDRVVVPPVEQLRLTGKGLPLPTAVLSVGAEGGNGDVEYAWRVNGGLWTTFAPAPSGTLEISHPSFLLQGAHRVEVRARLASDPQAISTPVLVGVAIDFEPPRVSLAIDRAKNRVVATARDQVSPVEALTWAYRVGTGEWSPFGAQREIDLGAVEAQGGVSVRARDEAGLVGEASWRAPMVALRPDAVGEVAGSEHDAAAGCSAGGGALSLLGAVLVVLCRRKAVKKPA